MLPETPPEFKRMCQNFGPEIGELVASWDDMVSLALHNLEIAEVVAIRPFIADLLSNRYDDEDLRRFWWMMPVTTVFHDGKAVRQLLTRILERISQQPYTR